jgi:hypothetical protein
MNIAENNENVVNLADIHFNKPKSKFSVINQTLTPDTGFFPTEDSIVDSTTSIKQLLIMKEQARKEKEEAEKKEEALELLFREEQSKLMNLDVLSKVVPIQEKVLTDFIPSTSTLVEENSEFVKSQPEIDKKAGYRQILLAQMEENKKKKEKQKAQEQADREYEIKNK